MSSDQVRSDENSVYRKAKVYENGSLNRSNIVLPVTFKNNVPSLTVNATK